MQNSKYVNKKGTVSKIFLRLVKSPQRLLATLLLLLLPFLLSLAGGIDLLGGWLYTTAHPGQADTRPEVFFLSCLQETGLCDKNTRQRFWPLDEVEIGPMVMDLSQPTPFLAGGLFVVAFFSLAALTSPRWDKAEAKSKVSLVPIPDPNPDKNWLIGALVRREWQSDPGFFYYIPSNFNPAKFKPTRANTAYPLDPYFLTTNMLRNNLLVVAPPGSGKTTSVIRPFIQFARKNSVSAFIFDSKGNDFNPAAFDLNFDITNFAASFRLVLFSGETPAQSGEQLAEALIPELNQDKAYFSEVAKNSLSVLVESHFAVTERYPEPIKLFEYISDPEKLGELQVDLGNRGLTQSEVGRLRAGLGAVLRLMEMKGDLLGNLRLALQALTHPDIARFLVANPEPNSFSIWDLVNRPGLVRLGLPVAQYPKLAGYLGRLILTQFNYAVLNKDVNTEIFKCVCVDEAHNFVTVSIGKGMNQARSNNAGFILVMQTLAQLEDKNLRDTVFGASGTKLVMAGVGEEDARLFSNTFGEDEFSYVSHSRNSGYGTNSGRGNSSGSSWASGGGGSNSSSNSSSGSSRNQSQGTNTTLHRRPKFLPSEVRELPQYHALMESSDYQGKRWFAQVVDLSQPTVAALVKLQTLKAEEQKGRVLKEEKKVVAKGMKKLAKNGRKSPLVQELSGSKNNRSQPDYDNPLALPQPVELQAESTPAYNEGYMLPTWELVPVVATEKQKLELSQAKKPELEPGRGPKLPQSVGLAEKKFLQPDSGVEIASSDFFSAQNDGAGRRPEAGKLEQGKADGNGAEEAGELERLLRTEADVRPQEIEGLLKVLHIKGRKAEDLKRLIEYASVMPTVKHRGSYIARLIRADDYPDEAKIARAKAKLDSGDWK